MDNLITDRQVIPEPEYKGPLGFPRFTSIGPLVEKDKDIIYHITPPEYVDSILKSGIDSSYITAVQMADGSETGRIVSNHMMEEYMDTVKDKHFPHIPDRASSVFFFPNGDRVREISDKTAIAVDADKIPCKGGIGSYEHLKGWVRLFYDEEQEMLMKKGTHRPNVPIWDIDNVDYEEYSDQVVDRLVEWYSDVHIYSGGGGYQHEIWYNCDIPPEAIEGVVE